MTATEHLKTAISMPELLRAYGFEVSRSNEILCPFHNEKTASCHVYNDGFHCFGCGAHGDIFDFVQRYFDLTFPQAVQRIAHDLGVAVDMSERRPSAEVGRIRRERQQQALEKARQDEQYKILASEHRRLCRDLLGYAPASPYDFVHERYVRALHRVEYVRYLLDDTEQPVAPDMSQTDTIDVKPEPANEPPADDADDFAALMEG